MTERKHNRICGRGCSWTNVTSVFTAISAWMGLKTLSSVECISIEKRGFIPNRYYVSCNTFVEFVFHSLNIKESENPWLDIQVWRIYVQSSFYHLIQWLICDKFKKKEFTVLYILILLIIIIFHLNKLRVSKYEWHIGTLNVFPCSLMESAKSFIDIQCQGPSSHFPLHLICVLNTKLCDCYW